MNGTRFEQKSFTVPAVDKAPEGCKHGWLDKRNHCVLCGEPQPAVPRGIPTISAPNTIKRVSIDAFARTLNGY